MFDKMLAGMLMLTVLLCTVAAGTDVVRLADGNDWKSASQDQYLLKVVEIKELILKGKHKKVQKAYDAMKKQWPQLDGEDFKLFVKAEVYLAKNKETKASKFYEKLLSEYPTSKFYDAAMDRQYMIGTAFLNGKKKKVLGILRLSAYDDGVKVMEKVSDRASDSDMGKNAALKIVDSYERREKFNDAYAQWSVISNRWPTGKMGYDALLGMARNKHSAFRGPLYDGSCLVSAKTYYENFRARYPDDAQKYKVDDILKQINEQLSYKHYEIGKYYQSTGSKGPAGFYYEMVKNDWPNSVGAKLSERRLAGINTDGNKK